MTQSAFGFGRIGIEPDLGIWVVRYDSRARTVRPYGFEQGFEL
jgi:hypothetical protein